MVWRILVAGLVGVFGGQALAAHLVDNRLAAVAWISGGVGVGILGAMTIMQDRSLRDARDISENAIALAERIHAQLQAVPPDLLAGGYVRVEDEDGAQIMRFPVSMN